MTLAPPIHEWVATISDGTTTTVHTGSTNRDEIRATAALAFNTDPSNIKLRKVA